MKSSSQVRALLAGKSSIRSLLNVNQEEFESFQIQYTNTQSSTKRKRTTDKNQPDLIINIPGFSGNIASRKLQTFITAGSHLVELLNVLNNN